MASQPHNRHQSSLRGSILDFLRPPSLTPEQRARAKDKFYRIIDHFKDVGISDKYNRPLLIRYTYEYALSEESRDIFLQTFFQSLALSVDDESDLDLDDKELEEELSSAFSGFADHLVDNFFLPLKASTKKTPQPSPIFHSAILRAQSNQMFLGTPDRVAALRGDCLIRDHHRCVISRKFDIMEMASRAKKDADDARDDEGELLRTGNQFGRLEVAHILPHSLTETEPGSSELNPTKKAALAILNMFDYGALDLINGHEIDRPRNAISLTNDFHVCFGNFDIYFTPATGPNDPPHTYKIETFLPPYAFSDLPVTRTLFLTEGRTIEPPEPRLFAIHRAIAHILHLSAAGDYIDKLLDEFERKGVQEDGTTELGLFTRLRLSGWYSGAVGSC